MFGFFPSLRLIVLVVIKDADVALADHRLIALGIRRLSCGRYSFWADVILKSGKQKLHRIFVGILIIRAEFEPSDLRILLFQRRYRFIAKIVKSGVVTEDKIIRAAFQRLGNSNKNGIANFEQYAHLEELNALASANKVLATAMGRDYMICPDVVMYRDPLEDEELNKNTHLVDPETACRTILRKANGGKQILHASVSSKWTIRSDRSQNSRTEALNLIRNRKGHLPHIVVITAEPLPSRIASIALGTGDIDCVYHSFLYELVEAVKKAKLEDAAEMLNIMIEGKRLKDISDLPFDLMI